AVEGPWNFGPSPDATLPVQALVAAMQLHWPALHSANQPGPHPHEAKILQLDSSRAKEHLGWRPVWDADTTLQSTVQWYRDFYERHHLHSRENLQAYVETARSTGLEWAA
ncbi:MAG: CDP-glucose 4,6-dehydratase, partial [Rhodanobacter sp.]